MKLPVVIVAGKCMLWLKCNNIVVFPVFDLQVSSSHKAAVWRIKTQSCEVHMILIILVQNLSVMCSGLLRSEESMPRIQLSALSFRHMYSPADTKLQFTTNSWKVSRLWCFTNYVFGRTYRKCLVSQLFEQIALHAFEMYYKVHRGQLLNAHCVFCDGMPTNRQILSMYREKTDNCFLTILILLMKKFTQKRKFAENILTLRPSKM